MQVLPSTPTVSSPSSFVLVHVDGGLTIAVAKNRHGPFLFFFFFFFFFSSHRWSYLPPRWTFIEGEDHFQARSSSPDLPPPAPPPTASISFPWFAILLFGGVY